MSNPRRSNGSRRSKHRRRMRAEGRGCWICQTFGRPSYIDYSLPAGHPAAFELDELCPVSRWREGGYANPEACAADWGNLAATHRACNQWRGSKSVAEVRAIAARRMAPARQAEVDALPQPW